MNPTGRDEMQVRRYLLGDVTDQEREQVEQQLMTDRQYFSQFLKVEEGLIDEYVRGELSPDEVEPFETHFLSAPERRDKLEFSKSLNRYIAQTRGPESAEPPAPPAAVLQSGHTPSRAARAWLAAAVLVLAAGVVMLLVENARTRARIDEQEARWGQTEEELRRRLAEQMGRGEELARQLEQSQNEAARVEQELARLRQEKGRNQESAAPRVASLLVAPGSVRDKGQTSRVNLSNDIQLLSLQLKLRDEGYDSYRAEVKTLEGKGLWRGGNLRTRRRAGEKTVIASVPARQLPEGDYLVTLSAAAGGEDYKVVATYYFTVLRE